MRIISTVLLLMFLGLFSDAFAQVDLVGKVKYASMEEAQELISTEDTFTDYLTEFDIHSRLHRMTGSKEGLFYYMSTQMREWRRKERKKIDQVVELIQNDINSLNLDLSFPDDIYFVKSTTKEEGGAQAYSRANYIVLNPYLLRLPLSQIKGVIAHELFHIYIKNNLHKREQLYGLIHFNIIHPVSFPDSFKDFKITNPEAPTADAYIKLAIKDTMINAMLVMYSDRSYKGGNFFDYIKLGFVELAGDGIVKEVVLDSVGYPVIYNIDDVGDYFLKVGRNTRYIIHPEEILAENFVLILNRDRRAPDQWILNQMKAILKK